MSGPYPAELTAGRYGGPTAKVSQTGVRRTDGEQRGNVPKVRYRV